MRRQGKESRQKNLQRSFVWNEAMSNVQHFNDVDLKLLPNIVEAVQKYENTADRSEDGYDNVKALSIVYEVMRKWATSRFLYTSH